MIEKILERLEASAEGAKDSKDLSKYSSYKQSIEIVQEVAKEYGKDTNVRSKLHIILDYLQFVRDNADKYDSEDGWSLSDLIILAVEYQKGE